MPKFGSIDLEIIHLGINGSFNENDIEESELNRLGVGRILDALASLKDRKLINLNEDGSFEITKLARNYLWDKDIPLWGKILRLLEIKSFPLEEIEKFLKESKENISKELESLRKKQLVLMSPIRKDEKLIRTYEILPDGKELLEKTKIEGFNDTAGETSNQNMEILDTIDQIISDISNQDINQKNKENIISRLQNLKEKIKI